MVISKAIVIATVLIPSMIVCAAQTAASNGPTVSGATAAKPFTPTAPSDILQRALDEVQQTVGAVKLDKWKRGSVRDEAGNNIDAMQRFLANTLPGLLKDADSAPGSLSKVLPLSRNVDALYDVLVHVVEEARISGTGEQAGQLQQAMDDLEKARVVLDNQMQQTAAAREKEILDLHSTVQTQADSLRAAATPPPAPKCPAPPTPVKRKKRAASSTTSKPAAGTPATTTPSKPQ